MVFDERVAGFGVRCQRARRLHRQAPPRGRQPGSRSAGMARRGPRKRAGQGRALLGEIASGGDPAAVRDHEKAAGTFAEFAGRYLEQYAATKKKPRSVESDRTNLNVATSCRH